MWGAARSWVRERPRAVDAAIAGLVFVYNLPVQDGSVPVWPPPWTGVFLSLGLCAPYVVGRDRPWVCFGLVVAASGAQLALGVGPMPADVMLFFALYAVAVRAPRRESVAAAGVVALCALLGTVRWQTPYFAAPELVNVLVLTVSVWMWGAMIGVRRASVAGLQDRAVQLEKERDDQRRIAAAAERARIAREMHDIVSHSLSVVVVLAEGASVSVRHDPDRAERAMERVEDTGRSALTEMRRMLDVLRDDRPASEIPQPGVAQLDGLVAETKASGTPVELAVRGTPRTLDSGTDLAVYRIAQEALTNARRHAGPRLSRVEVEVRYGEEEVRVRVADDGHGLAEVPASQDSGDGHGLVGLRERVAAHGGSLRVGERPGGGFELVATLPLGGTQ